MRSVFLTRRRSWEGGFLLYLLRAPSFGDQQTSAHHEVTGGRRQPCGQTSGGQGKQWSLRNLGDSELASGRRAVSLQLNSKDSASQGCEPRCPRGPPREICGPCAAAWMDLETLTLNEVSQRRTNIP